MTSTPKYSPRGPLALGSAHSGSGAGGERLSPSQPRGRSRRGRFGSGSDRAAGNSRLRRSKPGMCPQPRRWAGCLQPRPSGAAGSPPPSPPPPPPGGFRTRMLGTPAPRASPGGSAPGAPAVPAAPALLPAPVRLLRPVRRSLLRPRRLLPLPAPPRRPRARISAGTMIPTTATPTRPAVLPPLPARPATPAAARPSPTAIHPAKPRKTRAPAAPLPLRLPAAPGNPLPRTARPGITAAVRRPTMTARGIKGWSS